MQIANEKTLRNVLIIIALFLVAFLIVFFIIFAPFIRLNKKVLTFDNEQGKEYIVFKKLNVFMIVKDNNKNGIDREDQIEYFIDVKNKWIVLPNSDRDLLLILNKNIVFYPYEKINGVNILNGAKISDAKVLWNKDNVSIEYSGGKIIFEW